MISGTWLLGALAGSPCPPDQAWWGLPPVTLKEGQLPAGPLADLDGQLAVAPALERALDHAMSVMQASWITVAVGIPGEGLWTARRGGDERQLGWWASVGKSATAGVVMQLVAEGRLELEASASRWDARLDPAITIEHLLTHTSGLYSFQQDRRLRRLSTWHAPDELVAVSLRHGPDFCPGAAWSYSNTGYVILGQIIEQIEGAPYHLVVQRRIVEPLGLQRWRALAPQEVAEDVALAPARGGRPEIGPTTPFAAGAIVADAGDMVRYWRALVGGELGDVRAMYHQLYPMFGEASVTYGRGVMRYEVPAGPEGGPDTWLGHGGGSEGVKAVVAWSVETGHLVAVALVGEGSAEATAQLLLRASAGEGP